MKNLIKNKARFCFLAIITFFQFFHLSAQSIDPINFDRFLSELVITKYGNNEDAGKYINLRGIRMYFETYGSGIPLLLIHSNGGSINLFLNQISYFSKNYKVIAVDTRSQGKSAYYGDSLSYGMMEDDFKALLDSLKITSCNIIGWSDGGIIGLKLAMDYPDLVNKLVVTGANLWSDSNSVDPYFLNWIAEEISKFQSRTQNDFNKNITKLLKLMLREPNIKPEELHKIKCPTLVIAGDQEIVKPEHSALIAENIEKSNLWILPNCGHATLLIYPELFNAIVSEFMKKPFKKLKGLNKIMDGYYE